MNFMNDIEGKLASKQLKHVYFMGAMLLLFLQLFSWEAASYILSQASLWEVTLVP